MEVTGSDHLHSGDENSGNVDPEYESPHEESEQTDRDGRRYRTTKKRQRKRAKAKPTRPKTYIGQRGYRRSRESP